MLDRAREIWKDECKPKVKIVFRVLDTDVEQVPVEPPPEGVTEILFVT